MEEYNRKLNDVQEVQIKFNTVVYSPSPIFKLKSYPEVNLSHNCLMTKDEGKGQIDCVSESIRSRVHLRSERERKRERMRVRGRVRE